MFEQLKQRTLDLLAERAENYPFDGQYNDDEDDNENENNAQNSIDKDSSSQLMQYNLTEGIARFGTADNSLLTALNNICDYEDETIAIATGNLDQAGNDNSDVFELLLGATDVCDERLLQLQKCKKKLNELVLKQAKCDKILEELAEKYNSVTEKTSSLHDACDRMMSEQTQLGAANERISATLHYYQQYEWLLKKLATPKLSLTGTLFTQILSTIHECITFMRAHPEQREAEQYLHKYEQCLSRSLTALKAGVLADLETCRQDVIFRQSRSSSASSIQQQQNLTGRSTFTMLSCVDNDDTFALLYGVFGVKASTIRNAFQQAHQFFAEYPVYQTVVSECEHEYFTIRDQLLRPIVQATIQALCKRRQNSTCTLTRDCCTFLLRLCDDEFRLYRQFFILGGVGDPGTRASMTPSSPSIFPFWGFQSTGHQFNQFDVFIENLCRILYDTLRPLVIHNPHLETLAQLCTLLKVEIIDERCGLVPIQTMNIGEHTPVGELQQQQIMAGNSRAGFARVISELVADIVERIVYRTTLFAQSDILDYNPAQGDLVYPERLLMMREINKVDSGTENIAKNISETKNDEDECPEEAEQIAPLPITTRRGTETSNSGNKLTKQQNNSSSPIDQHCLWYPTVKRTVMCLSKLYRCLDPTVFLNVSRELLDACCQSLENAVARMRTLPINPARSTIHGCPNRALDAELFIVKHLLILREQTSPYRQHQKQKPPFTRSNSVLSASSAGQMTALPNSEAQIYPQLDYQLDLSKYTQSMLQLLNTENRARWFELGSNNALLSLLLLTPVHVSELQTDTRRIIEQHLKRWCHSMIGHASGLLLGPLVNFQAELDQLQAEQEKRARDQMAPLDVSATERFSPRALNDRCAQAFKQLKQYWPHVRAAFALYIGLRETEEILLQPIRRSVSNAFTAVNTFAERHYGEEQRQIISAPGQEQIWLIMNANTSTSN